MKWKKIKNSVNKVKDVAEKGFDSIKDFAEDTFSADNFKGPFDKINNIFKSIEVVFKEMIELFKDINENLLSFINNFDEMFMIAVKKSLQAFSKTPVILLQVFKIIGNLFVKFLKKINAIKGFKVLVIIFIILYSFAITQFFSFFISIFIKKRITAFILTIIFFIILIMYSLLKLESFLITFLTNLGKIFDNKDFINIIANEINKIFK